jgi:hypothetical protein
MTGIRWSVRGPRRPQRQVVRRRRLGPAATVTSCACVLAVLAVWSSIGGRATPAPSSLTRQASSRSVATAPLPTPTIDVTATARSAPATTSLAGVATTVSWEVPLVASTVTAPTSTSTTLPPATTVATTVASPQPPTTASTPVAPVTPVAVPAPTVAPRRTPPPPAPAPTATLTPTAVSPQIVELARHEDLTGWAGVLSVTYSGSGFLEGLVLTSPDGTVFAGMSSVTGTGPGGVWTVRFSVDLHAGWEGGFDVVTL